MTTTTIKPETTETTTSIVEQNTFLQELVLQMRAQDHDGVYRSWKDELVLANYVVFKEKKSQISVAGDLESATQLRILCFYQAIAACIEKQTGKLCQVVIDFSPEGFGRVSVWTGGLIVLSRTLRDMQHFGYSSIKRLADHGERLVDFAIKTSNLFTITNI